MVPDSFRKVSERFQRGLKSLCFLEGSKCLYDSFLNCIAAQK